jgi:hypothetical protein
MARNRRQPGAESARGRAGSRPGSRLPGLRWVPVPLAMLMAALGWLVFGSVLGQDALASAHAGINAGGLGLTVNQTVWMSDDMSGSEQPSAKGSFSMPGSMMPGMQAVGEKRLRIEVYIRNISTSPQRYALSDFRLLGTGSHSWQTLNNAATRGALQSAVLEPGFQTTLDFYFDIPASQGKHLSVEWSHGGSTITFPVHITGTDSTGVMVGM